MYPDVSGKHSNCYVNVDILVEFWDGKIVRTVDNIAPKCPLPHARSHSALLRGLGSKIKFRAEFVEKDL